MQDFITSNQVKVHLLDGLTLTPEIKLMAEQYAKTRARRPIVVHLDERNPGHHHIGFADAKTANKLSVNDPHMDLRFDGDATVHRIYTMDGLKPTQLTQEDLNLAKDLWQESLAVEIGPDGKPWIDD